MAGTNLRPQVSAFAHEERNRPEAVPKWRSDVVALRAHRCVGAPAKVCLKHPGLMQLISFF